MTTFLKTVNFLRNNYVNSKIQPPNLKLKKTINKINKNNLLCLAYPS